MGPQMLSFLERVVIIEISNWISLNIDCENVDDRATRWAHKCRVGSLSSSQSLEELQLASWYVERMVGPVMN